MKQDSDKRTKDMFPGTDTSQKPVTPAQPTISAAFSKLIATTAAAFLELADQLEKKHAKS